jgi:hypothetical protein
LRIIRLVDAFYVQLSHCHSIVFAVRSNEAKATRTFHTQFGCHIHITAHSQGINRVYWYLLQYHPETGRTSLGTHYRSPVWLPIVSNTGSHAGDSRDQYTWSSPPCFRMCGSAGAHTHKSNERRRFKSGRPHQRGHTHCDARMPGLVCQGKS